jgi:hypothetical protein
VGEKFEGPQAGFELLALLEVLALPSADRRLGSFVFDDRPARAASFAESVLQRSLLGHAPPFAV